MQHQHAAVVGVGGRAGRDLAQQVARDDRVGVGAADPERRLGGDAARPHVAEPAADAVGAELALRVLRLVAVPHRGDVCAALAICDHLVDGRIARDGSGGLFGTVVDISFSPA